MEPEVVKEKRDSYREKQLEVQKMVQATIKQTSEQWVAEIRTKNKSESKKFYNHVKSLSVRQDINQKFLIDEEEKRLEEQQALAHIHRVISEKFRELKEVKRIHREKRHRRERKGKYI